MALRPVPTDVSAMMVLNIPPTLPNSCNVLGRVGGIWRGFHGRVRRYGCRLYMGYCSGGRDEEYCRRLVSESQGTGTTDDDELLVLNVPLIGADYRE